MSQRAQYAPSREPGSCGGAIALVAHGSPAQRAGLSPGQRVLTVDGEPVHDVVDWQWFTDGERIVVEVADGAHADADGAATVAVERDHGEPWGLEFEEALFDGVYRCRNNCAFCFMQQLPSGMRPALYVRDDDYRLSFLQGNFITLTNLTDAHVVRIGAQHLSPLYVSVHSVTPLIRSELICAREDRALERIDELLDAGIDLHVQVVLVPGVNDGDELDATLRWLAEREGVLSVGIVPVGYTRYQERYFSSYEEPLAAATVIQQVQRWQFESRERDGVTWVHLADEFYLNARAPFPTAEWYDGYPQYDNGIGLVRSFADEVAGLRESFDAALRTLPADAEQVTVVTGLMAATTLAGALNALNAVGRVRLLAVPNRFFGGNVSVTGLLTGADIGDALVADRERLARPTAYLLPDVVLNADGVTLDDLTIDDIAARSGCDLRVVSSDAAGLLDGLEAVGARPPAQP